MKKFSIEATAINGCTNHEFINKKYNSAKEAINDFDSKYNRKGFRIMIYKMDEDREFKPVLFRIVKSTFR